jgi:hypothetical protein
VSYRGAEPNTLSGMRSRDIVAGDSIAGVLRAPQAVFAKTMRFQCPLKQNSQCQGN